MLLILLQRKYNLSGYNHLPGPARSFRFRVSTLRFALLLPALVDMGYRSCKPAGDAHDSISIAGFLGSNRIWPMMLKTLIV